MKKLLILLPLVLLLSACDESIAVKPVWPQVPDELKAACPDLKQVKPETDKLSDVIDIVVDNYSQYHDCQDKVDMWVEWYNKQQKIYESIK